jgi:serine phosphatase RsbU (regulator of sigma subunit)
VSICRLDDDVDVRPSSGDPEEQPPRVGLSCTQVLGGHDRVHERVALPGLQGILFSQPCDGTLGGDLHFLSLCGSGILSRLCVADVAGHGSAVAKAGAALEKLLRRHVNWPDQRRMLRTLNRELIAGADSQAFVTAVVLTYLSSHHRLSYSIAGHPPPWFFRRRTGEWARLALPSRQEQRGLRNGLLGVDPDAVFDRDRLVVEEGDRLLLVTDGLTDARPGGRMLGVGGVQEVLERGRDLPLEALAAELQSVPEGDVTPREQRDDVTFLLLEFSPPSRRQSLRRFLRNRLGLGPRAS